MPPEPPLMDLGGRPVQETQVQSFRATLKGALLRPGTEGYEKSGRIWNANVIEHPAIIVRCSGIADVVHSVNFARRNNILVSIKGGGHSIPGLGLGLC